MKRLRLSFKSRSRIDYALFTPVRCAMQRVSFQIFCLVFYGLFALSCDSRKREKLVGEWEGYMKNGRMVSKVHYTFREDGTGETTFGRTKTSIVDYSLNEKQTPAILKLTLQDAFAQRGVQKQFIEFVSEEHIILTDARGFTTTLFLGKMSPALAAQRQKLAGAWKGYTIGGKTKRKISLLLNEDGTGEYLIDVVKGRIQDYIFVEEESHLY